MRFLIALDSIECISCQMILTVAISGYRSLRDIIIPLEQLTIITGANGSGKSSFYRSLRLLADVAQGRAIRSLAQEGGMESILWAGPENISRTMKSGEHNIEGTVRTGPVSLKLGFADEDFGYAIDLGLPIVGDTLFGRDPVIKAEALWIGEVLRRGNVIAKRSGPAVSITDVDGTQKVAIENLSEFDSMMTHAANTDSAKELLYLRENMRNWRFYDHLRTDLDAPARQSRIGTRTPSLAADGSDLAAAIQTIFEIGDRDAFNDAISDAFSGASIEIVENGGYFETLMHQKGMLRPLKARELSDGTLRYLLLTAALMTPRPPPIIVLNEPETSLHRSLLEPLARLIGLAAHTTQIILVTHATELIDGLNTFSDSRTFRLKKEFGETIVEDCEKQKWEWPSR